MKKISQCVAFVLLVVGSANAVEVHKGASTDHLSLIELDRLERLLLGAFDLRS